MHLYILGRQPKLGLAELERLSGALHVAPFGRFGAVVAGEAPSFAQLGGSVKCVGGAQEIPYKNPGSLNSYLIKNAASLFAPNKSGRHTLAISIYGADVPSKKLNALLLSIKKQLRTSERSIRIIEHREGCALDSASVIHNGLLGENGRELVIAIDGKRAVVGLTQHEQDIESYTERDRGRPKRDAKVGMLPPKLAQIMLNLARPITASGDQPRPTLLDPFCGTGVVLQEALLSGLRAYGSDLDERMVRYTRDNIQWLQEKTTTIHDWYLERANAINHTWRQPVDAVVCETYLGPPLHSMPEAEKLAGIVAECDELHRQFLRNLAPQLAPGTPICLAVPAWRTEHAFQHLPVIDDLADLGYNRIDFTHVRPGDLLYYREDQFVARELLVLKRK